MLIMTNSAGLSGAKLTWPFTIFRFRSFAVVVSPSHLTKKALSRVLIGEHHKWYGSDAMMEVTRIHETLTENVP